MIDYDKRKPLIFIHVPKSAGSSVKTVFRKWFGPNLLSNYFNETQEKLPQRVDLGRLHTLNRPVAVYGHFNADRGFGVQDLYPQVTQFVTILRDPFETAISNYYYILRNDIPIPKRSLHYTATSLEEFLADYQPNILNHFPRTITMENYKAVIEEFFIEIGITESLSESVSRIARKLGFEFDPEQLPMRNASPRDKQSANELRESFEEKNPLEFAVYNHAKRLFGSSS